MGSLSPQSSIWNINPEYPDSSTGEGRESVAITTREASNSDPSGLNTPGPCNPAFAWQPYDADEAMALKDVDQNKQPRLYGENKKEKRNRWNPYVLLGIVVLILLAIIGTVLLFVQSDKVPNLESSTRKFSLFEGDDKRLALFDESVYITNTTNVNNAYYADVRRVLIPSSGEDLKYEVVQENVPVSVGRKTICGNLVTEEMVCCNTGYNRSCYSHEKEIHLNVSLTAELLSSHPQRWIIQENEGRNPKIWSDDGTEINIHTTRKGNAMSNLKSTKMSGRDELALLYYSRKPAHIFICRHTLHNDYEDCSAKATFDVLHLYDFWIQHDVVWLYVCAVKCQIERRRWPSLEVTARSKQFRPKPRNAMKGMIRRGSTFEMYSLRYKDTLEVDTFTLSRT